MRKPKSKILLIDDDVTFCNIFKNAYRNKYELTVINGQNAASSNVVIAALEKGDFSLILLDLFLTPGKKKNGFELIEVIRNKNAHIPIIAITRDDKKQTSWEAEVKYKIEAIIVKQEGSFDDWARIIDQFISDNPGA